MNSQQTPFHLSRDHEQVDPAEGGPENASIRQTVDQLNTPSDTSQSVVTIGSSDYCSIEKYANDNASTQIELRISLNPGFYAICRTVNFFRAENLLGYQI